VVLANLTKDNMIERRNGFEQTIKKSQSPGESSDPNYEVIDFLVDEGNEEKCRELVGAALDAHPDLACLVGMNSYHGPLLVKLLEEKDRLGKLKLVTFDDDPKTLAGVEAGHIYATVVQDPYLYGYKAVEWLATVCRGHEGLRPLDRSRSTYSVNTQSVRRQNLEDLRRQINERLEASPAG
jgi:ribose transport system substrate-binding protein